MGQKTVKKRQSYGFESSPNIILTIHLQLILEEKRMIPKEEAHVPRKRSREPTVLKTACGQWKRGWYQAQREENSPDTWEKEQDAEGHGEWGLVKKRKKEQTQAQGTFKACFVLFNNPGIARSIFSTESCHWGGHMQGDHRKHETKTTQNTTHPSVGREPGKGACCCGKVKSMYLKL